MHFKTGCSTKVTFEYRTEGSKELSFGLKLPCLVIQETQIKPLWTR